MSCLVPVYIENRSYKLGSFQVIALRLFYLQIILFKIRTRSQSKSPKSPKSRGRAKTVAVKRLKSPKDSSLHNKSHKIKKKKSKTVVRKSKSNENSGTTKFLQVSRI